VCRAQAGDRARAALPLAGARDPQGHQHRRVGRRSPRPALHHLDLRREGREVQPFHGHPDQPRQMVVRQQGIEVEGHGRHLLPLRAPQA